MNLLFDFDGTICDSLDALLVSTNPFMKTLGKPELTKKEIKEKGLLQILQENNIPKFLLPVIVFYVRRKLARLMPQLKPFDQIPLVLSKLSKENTLGIITSNSTKSVNIFLQKNNLQAYFDFVYSSINFIDKSARINNALVKHNLKVEESYFIGDETRDMNAAKLTGLKTLAVAWGIESKELLAHANPDAILSNPKELLQHFSK